MKRVSPWLVELVSNLPVINFTPFSPPRKKLRFPQQPEFPLDVQFPIPPFSGNQLGPNHPLCGFSDNAPAGIQGARHAQIGTSLSDLHLNSKLQLGLLPSNIQQHGFYSGISSGNTTNHDKSKESLSHLLTIGKSTKSLEKSDDVKKHQFLLFGQPILTEQQISRDVLSRAKKSSDDVKDKEKCFLDDSQPSLFSSGKASAAEFSWQLGLDTGHCKVFLESEDVGRTLDLSRLGSYEELYRRLSYMFGVERSEIPNYVFYYDAKGAVKQTGEEPFRYHFRFLLFFFISASINQIWQFFHDLYPSDARFYLILFVSRDLIAVTSWKQRKGWQFWLIQAAKTLQGKKEKDIGLVTHLSSYLWIASYMFWSFFSDKRKQESWHFCTESFTFILFILCMSNIFVGNVLCRAFITGTRNGEHGLDASNKTGPLSIFA